MTVTTIKPNAVTVRGRLSFPKFTMAEALRSNAKSKFKQEDAKVRPNYQLLLTDAAVEKLLEHVRNVFLPYCESLYKQHGSEDNKSALSPKSVKKLLAVIEDADWEEDSLLGLLKPVHEKTRDLAPEAVATVPVKGIFNQQSIDLKAIVRDKSELQNPLDDIIIPERGKILPLDDTKLEMYPGALVGTTLDLWAFVAAGNPGITASSPALVLIADAERFGGGTDIDEDELFMDLDD